MKAKKFYREDLSSDILDKFDYKYKHIYSKMTNSLNNDTWNIHQKKTQKKYIIPLIAIYKTLIDLKVEKEKAYELTKKWSEYRAHQFNKLIKVFSHIPKFKEIFFKTFKNRMAVPGIWENKLLKSNKEEFRVDITKCLWKETCDYFHEPELCKIFCDNDWIVFGNLNKFHLERESTLGLGSDKCDFKFVFDNKKSDH